MHRRSFRTRVFPLFAAVLLLGVALAPSLSRMTCVMSGHVELSLGAPKSCCPDEQGSRTVVKPVCCEFSQLVPHKGDFPTSKPAEVQHTGAPIAVDVMVPAMLPVQLLRVALLERRPPPLLASDRLARLGSFLI